MSALFLDSSALAKRYLQERGTVWLRQQVTQDGATVIVSRLAAVEVMSAIARRQREGAIDNHIVSDIRRLLDGHFQRQYIIIEPSQDVIREAITLALAYPLRAYDAVQLASAKTVNERLVSRLLPPITFLCADIRLLEIATASGLKSDNPESHS